MNRLVTITGIYKVFSREQMGLQQTLGRAEISLVTPNNNEVGRHSGGARPYVYKMKAVCSNI